MKEVKAVLEVAQSSKDAQAKRKMFYDNNSFRQKLDASGLY